MRNITVWENTVLSVSTNSSAKMAVLINQDTFCSFKQTTILPEIKFLNSYTVGELKHVFPNIKPRMIHRQNALRCMMTQGQDSQIQGLE